MPHGNVEAISLNCRWCRSRPDYRHNICTIFQFLRHWISIVLRTEDCMLAFQWANYNKIMIFVMKLYGHR